MMLIVFEMMVLVGGLCVIGVNYDGFKYGMFIDCLGVLMNDFFVNLLDLCIIWSVIFEVDEIFEGCDCVIGIVKWIGIWVDLIFGLNIELRVIVEVYGFGDGELCFV